jgi:hypothetical protein
MTFGTKCFVGTVKKVSDLHGFKYGILPGASLASKELHESLLLVKKIQGEITHF